LQELFVPGQNDPEQLTRGARRATLEARLAWSAGALPSPTGSQHRRWPAMAGSSARDEEGKRGLPDQELTGEPSGRSPWPEDRRRRQIWRRRLRSPTSESATASAIPGVLARFFGRGDKGRRGETSQQLGGAGGARDDALGGGHGDRGRLLGGVHGERGPERERDERERARERGERRGELRGVEVRLQEVLLIARTSRRWRSGTSSPPRSCFLNTTKKTKSILQIAP
jgi:hypothetical protein